MDLVLYSVNRWAAFHICEQYRGGLHDVWCSTQFDSRTVDPLAGIDGSVQFQPPPAL
jgi:hypothetical protein